MTNFGSKRRRSLTVGQVAKILGCASRTVAKWCDNGKIEGTYRLPAGETSRAKTAPNVGCGDRRVPRNSLIRFLIKNNVPIPPELVAHVPQVVCVNCQKTDVTALAEVVAAAVGQLVEIRVVNPVDVGIIAGQNVLPLALVVGDTDGRENGCAIVRAVAGRFAGAVPYHTYLLFESPCDEAAPLPTPQTQVIVRPESPTRVAAGVATILADWAGILATTDVLPILRGVGEVAMHYTPPSILEVSVQQEAMA